MNYSQKVTKENNRKMTIWSNMDLNLDDWRDDLLEENPDITEDDMYERMYEINNEYLTDVQVNFDITLPENIIVIANIGKWDGRHVAYNELHNCLSDVFYTECDYAEWYVDRRNNLRFTGDHHDGRNYYLYRMWKPGLSDTQKDNFCDKLYFGTVTANDISRYTQRLGDIILENY